MDEQEPNKSPIASVIFDQAGGLSELVTKEDSDSESSLGNERV